MRRLGSAIVLSLAAWLYVGQGPGAAQTSPTTTSTVRVTTSSPFATTTTSSTTSTTRPATATTTTTRAPLVNTGSSTGPTSVAGIGLVLLGGILVRLAYQRRINGPYRIRYR